MSDACYSFTVVNGATPGQLVVGRGPGAAAAHNGIVGDPSDDLITGSALNSVCASQFGNGDGGDVSYVAPCDADTTPDGNANHTVTLWVDALCDSAADPADLLKTGTPNWAAASPNNGSTICDEIQPYMNPCGSTGCSLPVTCVENADTPVVFNLTIMGQADQGFFDIAVNFQDIFCSAKFDTCYPDGDPAVTTDDRPIELLFGDDVVDGAGRDWTGVFGFACTAGSEAVGTKMLMGPLTVVCGTESFQVDPTLPEGNATATSAPGGLTLQYAIYRGTEGLDCGSGPGSCNKVYWNLAFNLEDLAGLGACTLDFQATANDDNTGWAQGLPTEVGVTWPYIQANLSLTTDTGPTCQQNPLNVPPSTVVTTYEGPPVGTPLPPMCYETDGTTTTGTASGDCCTGPDTDSDGIADLCDACPNGQTFQWATWNTPIVGATATGTVGAIPATYTTSAQDILTTASIWGYGSYLPAAVAAAYGIPNVNPTIANDEVTTNTLTFAQPVQNPMFFFGSIGNTLGNGVTVPIEFSVPVRLMWCAGLKDGPGPTANDVNCNGQMVNTIYGREGFAIVEATGTHTSVSFDYTIAEYYANFAFGFNTCN